MDEGRKDGGVSRKIVARADVGTDGRQAFFAPTVLGTLTVPHANEDEGEALATWMHVCPQPCQTLN